MSNTDLTGLTPAIDLEFANDTDEEVLDMQAMATRILERCRQAPDDLDKLKRQKARLMECAEGMNGQDLTKAGPRGTAEQDRMAAFSAEIDDVERKIEMRERQKAVEERVACLLIANVPAVMGEILYRYYVSGLKLLVIAQQNSYNPSYVRKLKARGDERIISVSDDTVKSLLPPWYLEDTCSQQGVYTQGT